jgi:hypothetical protein
VILAWRCIAATVACRTKKGAAFSLLRQKYACYIGPEHHELRARRTARSREQNLLKTKSKG